MRRARLSTDERGSAALEFLVVGLILLVPIAYLVIALAQIQRSALGAEAAARHLARTVASAPDIVSADERARSTIAALIDEYDWAAESTEVSVTCDAAEECPQPGALVRVTVRVEVPLPLVPPVLGLDERASIPVEAASTQRVARIGGAP